MFNRVSMIVAGAVAALAFAAPSFAADRGHTPDGNRRPDLSASNERVTRPVPQMLLIGRPIAFNNPANDARHDAAWRESMTGRAPYALSGNTGDRRNDAAQTIRVGSRQVMFGTVGQRY